MKKYFDILQIIIHDLGPFSWIFCAMIAYAFFQAWRLAKMTALVFVRTITCARHALFNPFKPTNAIAIALLATLLFVFSEQVSAGLQEIEQRFISPTYAVSDTTYFAEGMYEEMIKRHTNEAQFLTVRDSTRALAREIGCSPCDIYLVAYSECGLDPFRTRADGRAAGWIQFTPAGLSGLGKGLEQVKADCAARDAKEIMRLTGAYVRSWAKGRQVRTAADFYVVVFAPAKLGAADDETLYAGWNNPEYFLNKGLDGYFVEGEKVLHLPHKMDGRLTKRDLQAALKYKEAKLLGKCAI